MVTPQDTHPDEPRSPGATPLLDTLAAGRIPTEAEVDAALATPSPAPQLIDGRARDAVHWRDLPTDPDIDIAGTACRYAPPVEWHDHRLTWTPIVTTDPGQVTCAQCSNRIKDRTILLQGVESHDVFGALPDAETYDEDTLRKVYDAIAETGLTPGQATDLVNAMQNRGVLFRERSDTSVELVADRIGPVPLSYVAVNGYEIPVDMIALGATLHDVSEGILTVTFIGVRTVETVYRWMDQP